ncbi:hypothetical protein GCM10023336_43110 [Streptomyces similanensis]|uniref:Uncharacterized protein n=1 Tax=Streptomyces similanensis TaxID=1274988 RepID=A0ABP9KQ85_9ACTN
MTDAYLAKIGKTVTSRGTQTVTTGLVSRADTAREWLPWTSAALEGLFFKRLMPARPQTGPRSGAEAREPAASLLPRHGLLVVLVLAYDWPSLFGLTFGGDGPLLAVVSQMRMGVPWGAPTRRARWPSTVRR